MPTVPSNVPTIYTPSDISVKYFFKDIFHGKMLVAINYTIFFQAFSDFMPNFKVIFEST